MSKRNRNSAPTPCPCGRGVDYASCCGPFHAGAPAPDAEALMRSRYSAYVQERDDYLLATWHPTTRPAQLDLKEDSEGGATSQWLGLEVRRHEQTDADHAMVEFVARYRVNGHGGPAQRLHEISSFIREDGRWYYLQAVNDSN